MNSEMQQQPELLPAEPAEPVEAVLMLTALPADDAMPGDPPDEAFVGLVRQLGILQPIGVIQRQSGMYDVAFGRRRIKAARACGMESIPARVWPATWTAIEVLTLVENSARKPNAASDYRSIMELVNRGYTDKQIALAMGVTVSTVRAKMRLSQLPDALLTAFTDNRLPTSIAMQIVRQSPSVRERLATRYVEAGEIKAADIDAARRVQTASASSMISSLLADVPSTRAKSSPEIDLLAVRRDGAFVEVQIVVDGSVKVGSISAKMLAAFMAHNGMLNDVDASSDWIDELMDEVQSEV